MNKYICPGSDNEIEISEEYRKSWIGNPLCVICGAEMELVI